MINSKFTFCQRVLVFIEEPNWEHLAAIFSGKYVISTDADIDLLISVRADRINKNGPFFKNIKDRIVSIFKKTNSSQKIDSESITAAKIESESITAAKCGDIKLIKKLVNMKKYDPHCLDENRNNPLHCAIAHGHLEIVKYLLEHCANKHNYDKSEVNGKTVLHIAAEHGRLEIMKYLVENRPVNRGLSLEFWHNARGTTPFFVAAEFGHLEVMKYWISVFSDTDVNETSYDRILNILTESSRNGHLEVVKFLISLNADVNALKCSYSSPIEEAIYKCHYEVVKCLLENGSAIIIIKPQEIYHPIPIVICCLQLAIAQLSSNKANEQSFEVFKILLDNSTLDIINSVNWEERTALSMASECGNIEVVKCLLNKGVQVDDGNDLFYNDGPPLYYAIIADNLEMVELLLKSGASTMPAIFIDDDYEESTLLDIATKLNRTNSQKIVELLIKYGAQPVPISR
ncbi:MAG: ankyrin repeat domain-containing protein [Endozoicomonadaceae bacterium]|nr:ankyrin repeat domain-containing protein [Endozoicomonadaceae bacterium]